MLSKSDVKNRLFSKLRFEGCCFHSMIIDFIDYEYKDGIMLGTSGKINSEDVHTAANLIICYMPLKR